MAENTQLQVQELTRFAQEQQFNAQYQQYFGDVWEEAGVKDISKMTVSDAEQTLKVLAASEASPQFVKSLLAQAAIDGAPPQVLEYFLSSDIDGDGRTLVQEIFQDGTNPLEPDTPQPSSKAQALSPSQEPDLEWEI
ncbi:conserved hypothetical protein (plasmid) [Trichormus variabilis ATCC 29413]|uniref:Uncharacterized protein n=2 Tax=Anabaena variabilis TaxID=264691 RepID=Q3M2M7_TRIV2|nr:MULTISPECIES: hypothetical protein [Nostocaceae]ABA24759.1 conserved hypothetical protein [Trichormus variabilis ATCC 29413]MBC1218041.1 hypothetical protein [Trichormus variabilis ARAD]MBC1259347.1 hypothetical protein [Trichormus variabilis V5]MBC1270781.1 hypothetical protein [Trichormus variabilis FSR]MBC1305688.1 hypothetical protein [Trichormus variabilis N2B]